MRDNIDWDIRFIDEEEWEEAMSLAYSTFLEFDASDFSKEGIGNFRNFVSDNGLKRMFEDGFFQVIGAYHLNKLVGLIALKNNSHISLLFVDGNYHRKGIGRNLVMTVIDYSALKLHTDELTVNASPYAVEFYHKLGFIDTSEVISSDGVQFTPMKYVIRES